MNNLEIEVNNGFKKLVSNYETLIEFIEGEIDKGDEDRFWAKKWHECTSKKLTAQFQIKEEQY